MKRTIPVKLPVVVELADFGESESDHYADDVIDFLRHFFNGKIKYKHLGYVKRDALVIFYTNGSDPVYKKMLKKAEKEIAEWQAFMEAEEAKSYCSRCGRGE